MERSKVAYGFKIASVVALALAIASLFFGCKEQRSGYQTPPDRPPAANPNKSPEAIPTPPTGSQNYVHRP